MHPHCELAVNEILPAVRSLIASYLKEEKRFSQQKIADLLMITQPAVSKYLKQIRAKQSQILKEDIQVYQMIKDSAEKLVQGITDPHVFCEICDLVRKKKLVCEKCAYGGLCPKIKEQSRVLHHGYQ